MVAFLRGPTHVDFNLTNGCNLACSHCHSASGPKLDNELKTEEILQTIDALHIIGALKIAFAGGEPFIRRDIFNILSHACSLPGWGISVITNGFYLNSLTVEKLKAQCPNLSINISVDGSTPAGYSTLRKQLNRPDADPQPLFERVLSGIDNVVRSGMSNSVNFTITKATLHDIEATYELVVDRIGADNMVAIKFFPGGYGKEHLDLYEIPYDMWDEHFVALTRAKLGGKLERLQISVPAAWEFSLPLINAGIPIEEAEEVWGYRSPLREDMYARMREVGDVAGISELCISSDGEVYPSVLLVGEKTMSCGNLREHSLQRIWQESSCLMALRELKLFDLNGNCTKCGVREVCGGGSRSRAFSREGDFRDMDYVCPIVEVPLVSHA